MIKLPRSLARKVMLVAACLQLGTPAYAKPAAAKGTDPEAVVRQLYSAYRAGDDATARKLFSKDVNWVWYGPKYIIPFAGTYTGPDGVAQFFKDLKAVLKDTDFDQREYIVDGEMVAVPGFDAGTVRATGGRFNVKNLHMFKVRNGQIIGFEEYIDTADIIEAFTPADSVRGKVLLDKCNLANAKEGRGAVPALRGNDALALVEQLRSIMANPATAPGGLGACVAGLPGDRGLRDVASYVASLPVDASKP